MLLAGVAPAAGWAQVGQAEGGPAGGGQAGEQAASAGPGRIVCNATFCELAVSDRTRPRLRVIIADLPEAEIRRLRKCTGVAQPCVVSVSGTVQENPFRIMATEIHWQEPDHGPENR